MNNAQYVVQLFSEKLVEMTGEFKSGDETHILTKRVHNAGMTVWDPGITVCSY